MALQTLPDLANEYRGIYRAKFQANLEAGTAQPFIVPYHLLGYWVIPAVYLAIPHRDRPWLYHARWLVLGLVVAFHWHMICNVSSFNFGFAYGTGLLGTWAIIWNFHLLVWTRPQWDAKRVEQRQKILRQPAIGLDNGSAPRQSTHLNSNDDAEGQKILAASDSSWALTEDWLIQRRSHLKIKNESASRPLSDSSPDLRDGNPDGMVFDAGFIKPTKEHEWCEYYWQEYPINDSFWTRLDWAFDIASSFRLTGTSISLYLARNGLTDYIGWNWAPSYLPPYRPPRTTTAHQDFLETGPHISKQGYERTLSLKTLAFSRLASNILPGYLVVDLCTAVMTTDPYFVAGPNHDHPLPQHLAPLHPLALSLFRTLLAFVAIISALQFSWNCGVLVIAVCCQPILGFRAHPWHLPTMMGSFDQILDRGLAGYWGAWWHQSFRIGFSAPTKWLLRQGYLPRGRNSSGSERDTLRALVGAFIAFANSAFLHAAASYTSVPDTWLWGPPLFFALSGVGVVVHSALAYPLWRYFGHAPRWVRRAGNLAFVFLWLWATAWLLIDDLSSAGLWLWEPVPFSFARAVGFGSSTDRRLWRYDADFLPRWHWGSGGRWWETGLAI